MKNDHSADASNKVFNQKSCETCGHWMPLVMSPIIFRVRGRCYSAKPPLECDADDRANLPVTEPHHTCADWKLRTDEWDDC